MGLIIFMRRDVSFPWNYTWHLFRTYHYTGCGRGSSHIAEVLILWIIQVAWESVIAPLSTTHDRSDRPTTTSHMHNTTRVKYVFFSVERNNHAYTFKFTWLCKTTWQVSRMCHISIVLLVCKSRLVADHRYLLSGTALSTYLWGNTSESARLVCGLCEDILAPTLSLFMKYA